MDNDDIINGIPNHVLIYDIILDFLSISHSSNLFRTCKKLNNLLKIENFNHNEDDPNNHQQYFSDFWEIAFRNFIKQHQKQQTEMGYHYEVEYENRMQIHGQLLRKTKLNYRYRNYVNYWLYTKEYLEKSRVKLDKYLHKLTNDVNSMKKEDVNRLSKKLLSIATLNMKKREIIFRIMSKFMEIQILQLNHFGRKKDLTSMDQFFLVWEQIFQYIESTPYRYWTATEIHNFHIGKQRQTLVHHFFKQLSVYYYPGEREYSIDEKFQTSNRVYQHFYSLLPERAVTSIPHRIRGLWCYFF